MTRTRRGAEEEGGELVKAMIRNVLGLIEFSMMMTRPASGTHNPGMSAISLKRYAWLSIGAAVTTIALKSLGWWLTGSVGLLSDALESVVNLTGALMALAMITIAEVPADERHAYGHG